MFPILSLRHDRRAAPGFIAANISSRLVKKIASILGKTAEYVEISGCFPMAAPHYAALPYISQYI